MTDIERLPGQTEGIGFEFQVIFYQPYTGWIEDLVNSQMFGYSSSNVAQGLLYTWLREGPSNLSQFGINSTDAKRLGFVPCKFESVSSHGYHKVHEEQPLNIQVCGMGAYRLDKLVTLEFLGNTREKVAKTGIENQILDTIRRSSNILDFRQIRQPQQT
jgi:hypothetical protein